PPGEIRQLSLRIFDRSFAVTYAMEPVAMLVGLFGLSSSLGAIVLARRREFGMLRHLGLTRAQIRAMLAAEGGLLALLGALAGLAAGAAISLVLVYVVNRQSFNWSMELHPPYGLLGVLILILDGLAVFTAIFSGKEAMGIGPVRAARARVTLAHAETERTGVWIDDSRLVLEGDKYHSQIAAREFDLDLTFFTSDRPLFQGEAGFSRKGHRPEEASYYYSRPHLHVVGSVNGRQVDGAAWLDHEWSSAYLAPEAAGWDWTGINLFDGGSLTAFRMRGKKGGVHYAPP